MTHRSRRSLSALLLLAVNLSAAEADSQTRFEGEGRVVAVDEGRRAVILEHGPIADVFPADRTEFTVQDVGLLRQVRVGDTVSFSLAFAESGGSLTLSTLVARRPPEPGGMLSGVRLEYVLLSAAVLSGWAAMLVLIWIQGHRLERALDRMTKDLAALSARYAGSDARSEVRGIAAALGQIGHALRNGFGPELRRRIDAVQGALRDADGTAGRGTLQLVVRRGNVALFEALQERLETPGPTQVIWDRRQGERRGAPRPHAPDRRRTERRVSPQLTWTTLGFVVTSGDTPPGRLSRRPERDASGGAGD